MKRRPPIATRPDPLFPSTTLFRSLGGVATGSSQAVGVGAILGAPFMLSTLAMFVTGTAIVIYARRGRRTADMRINTGVLGRDVMFFIDRKSTRLNSSH